MLFQWPIRVYIEDTDLGGIVYYVNYLKYMERARTELLRRDGFSQQALQEQDILFVVTHADVQYIRSARLDDELLVSVAIEQCSGVRATFLQEITRASDSVLLCRGKVEVACVSALHMKPRRWPVPIMECLSINVAQSPAFEEK